MFKQPWIPWLAILTPFLDVELKESFGARKENNSLKGPLLNHLTSEKTKYNFSSTLMLQDGCIYLGHIKPCPETYHPLHPPRRLITPLPNYKCHLNKRILKISCLIDISLITFTNLPVSMKLPCSLSALSLVIRLTIAPPCLNKGNLLLLRSSFFFCLSGTVPYKYAILLIYYWIVFANVLIKIFCIHTSEQYWSFSYNIFVL